MATASTAHLRDIAAPLSPADAQRLIRLPNLPHLSRSALPALVSLPHEDHDAALTGSTRSLARRLFALNLHAQAAQPIPASPHRPASSLPRSA